MQIKSIVAGAAIALVAGLGSASAGDEFATLDGVVAVPLAVAALDAVRGTKFIVQSVEVAFNEDPVVEFNVVGCFCTEVPPVEQVIIRLPGAGFFVPLSDGDTLLPPL